MLNNRLGSVLRELMASKTPVTGDILATINQVSTRTIREDIKKLDDLLYRNGANIVSIMGQGYLLKVSDKKHFTSYLNSILDHVEMSTTNPQTPEERVQFLVKRLLFSDDFIKLEELAEAIFVSKSTVQNDMKAVRELLNEYELDLVSRPNYGVKVIGEELKLRFCMSQYIINRTLISKDHLIYDKLTFDQNEFEIIYEIMMNQVKINHLSMSDIAINNLLIHLIIACERIKKGFYIKLYKEELTGIIKHQEFNVAKAIVSQVEMELDVHFPENEVAYIAIHLLGSKMSNESLSNNKLHDEIMDEDLSSLIRLALKTIKKKLKIDLVNDQEVIVGLHTHLKPAINRMKYNMNVRNPMLEDIKKGYPLAFEAAVILGVVVKDITGFTLDENEMGYIALHIGAAITRMQIKYKPKRCLIVCASGVGTSQLIYYKLQSEFGPRLDIVGTTELYNLNDYVLTDIDFIVSSIPIDMAFDLPVIEVNAIVSNQDLEKINSFINERYDDANPLIKKDWTFLQKSFKSKEVVLRFLTNKLMEEEMVDEDFLYYVNEREKIASTSFGNLVAIPHPIAARSKRTILSICTLKKPIDWDGSPVQFVCLLSIKKQSAEDLQAMYRMLGKIIEDPKIIQELVKATTYEEFASIITSLYKPNDFTGNSKYILLS